MAWTYGLERAKRTATHNDSIGNQGKDQIRRMVLALERDRGGGASDGLGPCAAAATRFGKLTNASVCAEPVGVLVTAA